MFDYVRTGTEIHRFLEENGVSPLSIEAVKERFLKRFPRLRKGVEKVKSRRMSMMNGLATSPIAMMLWYSALMLLTPMSASHG